MTTFRASFLSLLLAGTASAQVVTGGGGSSTAAPIFNVKTYGAIGNTQRITDGVTAGGAKTITSVSGKFASTDVGKFITCVSNGSIIMNVGAKIASFQSATQITTDTNDNGAATSNCLWYTQDDTSAFQAANTAANPASGSLDPNSGLTILPIPGTVYCPEGGYAVSGRIFSFIGSGSNIGPNFVGAGKAKCIIYPLPSTTDPGDGFGIIFNVYNYRSPTVRDFTIEGLGRTFGFTHPVVHIFSVQKFLVENIDITNIGAGGGFGVIYFGPSTGNGIVRNVFVQGSGPANPSDFACMFDGATTIVVENMTCSNHNQNLKINNTGLRTTAGDNGITFTGGIIDECDGGTVDCAVITTSSLANFYGTTFMQGSAASHFALNVDATSRAYLSNVSCGVFAGGTAVSNCMTIASGGEVDVTMSDLRGNGATGCAVTGVAGSIFNDIGGNKILHSSSNVITPVTAANFTTLGFCGGIIPKATVTHTPNTCYAVTGNLLATAQNLCTLLLDQNYLVLNITAQSGGTTPANSSCTGAPVITMSDGTRTATLTMTTGKTAWSSAVDVATVNSVFASGTTLTVSIGANTCATPPANVSVNYVLESVLNP